MSTMHLFFILTSSIGRLLRGSAINGHSLTPVFQLKLLDALFSVKTMSLPIEDKNYAEYVSRTIRTLPLYKAVQLYSSILSAIFSVLFLRRRLLRIFYVASCHYMSGLWFDRKVRLAHCRTLFARLHPLHFLFTDDDLRDIIKRCASNNIDGSINKYISLAKFISFVFELDKRIHIRNGF